MPQPRTSWKRSKKMIQITKYMKSLTTMPMACDRNAARYSMAASRLAFQTARRNLSSFILTSIHRKIRHAAPVGKCEQDRQNDYPDDLKGHHIDKQFDCRRDEQTGGTIGNA